MDAVASRARTRTTALPLVELLVVVAIIALLISVLLPSLGTVKIAAKAGVCPSNEHQIGVALNMAVNDLNGWIFTAQPWSQPRTDEPTAS